MHIPRLSPRAAYWLRLFLLAVCLVGTYAVGLSIRRDVLDAQVDQVGPDLPFTLESALHYRRVKIHYDRGFLPERDDMIQYPEGINIREIDGVTSEPVYAFLAHWFPAEMPFANRMRWLEAGWFCLSIPLLAVAVRLWTGSWAAGFLAALFYAVAMPSVLRSTGQELSRENFAVPGLMAAMVAAAAYLRAEGRTGRWWWILFSLACGFTLMAWDLMQFMVGMIALGMTLHVGAMKHPVNARLVSLLSGLLVAVIYLGLMNPYHRHHGLLFSPMTVWLLGLWLAGHVRMAQPAWLLRHGRVPPLFRLGMIMIAPPVLVLGLSGMIGAYGASYGHFGDLLFAKIRFLNEKPADPALLSYYQRIMWVPSLHSATWELTTWLFPYSIWITGAFSIVAWFISRHRQDPLIRFWLLVFGISLLAYVLFVRFHVFVALAMAFILGWMCSWKALGSWWIRTVAVVLVLAACVAEGMHTSRQRYAMGRPNVYYQEMTELAQWLEKHVSPEPVLANMGISASIAAYGKCSIVIHPKFEDPSIRQRLEQYGNLLFGDDEKALRDWMDALGVRFFVYAKGEFAREKPEYQMRYFVNRMDPPESSPARRFERDDESLRYFRKKWGNRKYTVYETLRVGESNRADALVELAAEHLAAGRLADAEARAMQALTIDQQHDQALKIMRHVGSLVEQGVRVEPGVPVP